MQAASCRRGSSHPPTIAGSIRFECEKFTLRPILMCVTAQKRLGYTWNLAVILTLMFAWTSTYC